MNIKIDYHERDRAEKGVNFYTEKGHDVSIEKLYTGDFLFEDKVVFEYKSYSDMFNSIPSKRVFDEALRQKDNYPYHFVIIVGTEKDRKNELYKLYKMGVRFNMKQYYGAVARLNTYTNVIYAPTVKKAFQIMLCQAEKCLDSKPIVRVSSANTDNPAFNLLMFLPDIKEARAKLLVDNLDLKVYDDLKSLTYDDLVSIKGIGDKTAESILTHLHRDYGL